MSGADTEFIDLRFHVTGSFLPKEHSYHLYSSLCKELEFLHAARDLFIDSISGELVNHDTLKLTKNSRLLLRIPATLEETFLSLIGKQIIVSGNKLLFLSCDVSPLYPSLRLESWRVVIRGCTEASTLIVSAKKKLLESQIDYDEVIALVDNNNIPSKRILEIHGKRVIGYGLTITGLSPEHSIKLQKLGIGGKGKLGCGLFVP